MLKEKWKHIIEHEDSYLISNFGKVYSLKRDKLMKTPIHKYKGYRYINLKGKVVFIHVLVARMFIGVRPKGLVVGHKDQNKLNNYVENLEYCTQAKNVQDMALHSKQYNRKFKLNWKLVKEIRELYVSGWTIFELEEKYDISNSMAYKVCHNLKWIDNNYIPV